MFSLLYISLYLFSISFLLIRILSISVYIYIYLFFFFSIYFIIAIQFLTLRHERYLPTRAWRQYLYIYTSHNTEHIIIKKKKKRSHEHNIKII